MNIENKLIFPSTSFTQDAEQYLIKLLLQEINNNDFKLQRLLSTYPGASEQEKGKLILKIMTSLWPAGSPSKLFDVFRDFDTILSLIKGKGNFIHSFEVYLLGFHIIKLILDENDSKIFHPQFRPDKRIYDSWLVASTAHDFGYPLEVMPKLAEKLSSLFDSLYLNAVSVKAKKLHMTRELSLQQSLLKVEAYNIEKRKYETVTVENFILDGIKDSIHGNINDAREIRDALKSIDKHSYVSALILARSYIEYLSSSEKWKKKNEIWRIHLLKKEAAAIALHALPSSSPGLINQISFTLNPIAFILFLVDNIQDWNRSLRPNDKFPIYNLTQCQSLNNELTIGYTLEHDHWKDEIIVETRKYIQEKFKLLAALRTPNPSLNIVINIIFVTDHGIQLQKLTIPL